MIKNHQGIIDMDRIGMVQQGKRSLLFFDRHIHECPSLFEGGNFLLAALFPAFLLLMGIIFEYCNFDVWWLSHFYDFQSLSWPFRDHWLFNRVIHDGGRFFNIGAALVWLIVFFLTFFLAPLKKFKKIMVYFLAATLVGPLIVGAIKHLTHIYTPWDLKLFSGTLPYIRLFDSVPPGLPVGEGFPAGHASGGYAYFSLYFSMHHMGSRHKIYGVWFALGLGLIFGIGQQVRGAHFPSHDLFSMAICWYAALTIYYLFYKKKEIASP